MEVNLDGNPKTAEIDASFALILSLEHLVSKSMPGKSFAGLT